MDDTNGYLLRVRLDASPIYPVELARHEEELYLASVDNTVIGQPHVKLPLKEVHLLSSGCRGCTTHESVE